MRIQRSSPHQAAFTRTELTVVVAVLALIGTTLLPVLADGRSNGKLAQCLSNFRQMMAAMSMYTQDNGDLFPPNPDDNNSVPGHNWCMGDAGPGGAAEYDPDRLKDKTRSLLAVYLNANSAVFRCPSDPRPYRAANGLSATNPAYQGKLIPAARTVAMNQAVGNTCLAFRAGSGHSGKPKYAVVGPWLTGTHNPSAYSAWRTYGSVSDLVSPTPANLWILLEESIIGLNDGGFGMSVGQEKWIDYPGYYHDFGGVFGFADGRAEHHRWQDPRTRIPPGSSQLPAPGSVDWQWMAERTSARRQ